MIGLPLLTSNIMSPGCTLKSEDVIQQRQEIQGLIQHENMPPFHRVIRIVELDYPHDDLGWYDEHTSSQRHPSNRVDRAANVALQEY